MTRPKTIIFLSAFTWRLATGLAVASAPAVETDVAPPPVEPTPDVLVDSVAEIADLLEDFNLSLRGDAERERVIEAIVRVADPGARILAEGEIRSMEELAEGVFYEPGLHVTRSNGTVIVTAVQDGSSAAGAGIAAGDVLLSIDGRSVEDANIADVARRLRSDQEDSVELTLQTASDEIRDVRLDRSRTEADPIAETLKLPAGLCYVRVNGLFHHAGPAIADVLCGWAEDDASGIVIDLRGANGTNIESVVDVASLLSPPQSILFSYRDAEDRDIKVHRARAEEMLRMPLMLLVDEETTGASEVLAAALSGTSRGAMIIGQHTAGDPGIRSRVALQSGEELYLATRQLVIGDGARYAGPDRVKPDIYVDPKVRHPDYELEEPLLTDHRGVTDRELETRALRLRIHGDAELTRAVDVLVALRALNLDGFGDANPAAP